MKFKLSIIPNSISQFGYFPSFFIPSRNSDFFHNLQFHLAICISYFGQPLFHLAIWIFCLCQLLFHLASWIFLSRNLDFLTSTRFSSISQFGFSHIAIWISSSRNLDISEERVISHHLVISPSRNLDIPLQSC